MTGRGGRRLRHVALATAAALVVGIAPFAPDASAAPPPWPIDPSDEAVAAHWGDRSGRDAGRGQLRLRVDAVTPHNPGLDGELSLRLTVSNPSADDIDDIVVRWQRAAPLDGARQARTAMAEPEQAYGVVTSFDDAFDLGAGESRSLTLSVPVGSATPAGLGITEPGVYPILVNANGRPGDDIEQFLAETRMLVPVSDPDEGTGGADAAGAEEERDDEESDGVDGGEGGDRTEPGASGSDVRRDDEDASDEPVPLSMIWPLAAHVPLVPGETGEAPGRPELIMSSESLAGELEDDGRLHELLEVLESELAGPAGPGLRASTCVAVDPELLDVVDRMRDGYRVGADRPSPVEGGTRLRDSWGRGDDLNLGDGRGADAAAEWLARLETVTRDLCLITLPWSGAELNAVAATADPDLATEALAAGDDVVERVLGRPPLDSVVVPPEGYLDAGSVPVLGYGDTTTDIDAGAAFESLRRPGGVWPPADARTTSLVAANSLTDADGTLARAGETVEIAPGANAFGLPVPLSAALAATGRSPETAGYASVDGRYDLEADSSTARMQTVVGTLHQEIADASLGAGPDGAAPLVAMPPTAWSVTGDDARTLLRSVAATFDEGLAEPVKLGDALAASSQSSFLGPGQTASPNPDPGAVSGTEVNRAQQQSAYLTDLTVMMANDPQVALTRHGFTRPLRRDVLRAVSGIGRRHRDDHLPITDRANATMAGMGEMLQQLRDSVTLVAPGGVYTRATEMSPVVIVARNGLPLPVPAYVRVQVGDADTASRHEAMLPAKGSLTLQLTPETPTAVEDSERSAQLRMWLETNQGQQISAPVDIVARTGPSTATLVIVSIALTLAVGVFALRRSGRFEGFRRIRTQWERD
ncbi:hypothetical protein [uncultured Corynebacterium sp.]|uniref:hypothetical protein n=1 Tax=uncultured Corynebacterium sp. TaxID=159447 RepID=UPI0025ED842F|nr:hypothetical protein [uncultured Corynebacterium sp.]